MSIEDFKMYEEWSRYRESLKEQVVVPEPRQAVVAGWGRRFGAYLIDNILLGVPLGFYIFSNVSTQFASMAGSVDPVTGQPDPAGMESFMADIIALQFKVNLIYVALAAVYYIVCHGSIGQTIGKMAVGIRLVRTDGEKAGWAEALKRAIINPAAYLVPGVGGLAVILNGLWPLWDEKKQSLGDKVAGTLVVEA